MQRSKGVRRAARKLRYKHVRERIATGDVLLFKGKGLLSAIIRWGTDSDYSHAAVASWEGERLMIFHAVGAGLRHVPASEAVHKYDGQVDWWSVKPEHRATLDRPGIVEEARKHVGKPFAVWGLIKLAFLMLIGRYKNTKDGRKSPPEMFCSWYVATCYRVGGKLDLVPGAADDCTSPKMLEDSPRLMIRGVLHRDAQKRLTDEPVDDSCDAIAA